MKTSGFSVNEFLLMRKVCTTCLFSLKLAYNDRFEPKSNFDFGLILGFRANFYVVRVKNVFYKVFRVFFLQVKNG